MLPLDSEKTGWELTTSHLLSVEWCWILTFGYFLPILQSWAGFLHMLTSFCKDQHSPLWREWAGSQPGCVYVCMRNTECLQYPNTSQGDPHVKHSQWLMAWLSDIVHKVFGRTQFLWYVSSPGCYFPYPSVLLSQVAHPVFWMRWERSGPLRQHPILSWEIQVLTHMLSLSAEGEITSLEYVPWPWPVLLRKEWCEQSEILTFTLFNVLSQFFCSSGVLELLQLDS